MLRLAAAAAVRNRRVISAINPPGFVAEVVSIRPFVWQQPLFFRSDHQMGILPFLPAEQNRQKALYPEMVSGGL